jgi:hypothetical protein
VLTRTAAALEAEGSRSAMVALLTFAAHVGLSRTHHVVGNKIDFAAGPAAMLADASGLGNHDRSYRSIVAGRRL